MLFQVIPYPVERIHLLSAARRHGTLIAAGVERVDRESESERWKEMEEKKRKKNKSSAVRKGPSADVRIIFHAKAEVD